MAKPPYINARKAKTSVTIINPRAKDPHRFRTIWIAPRTKKNTTKYNPRDIQEDFHPEETRIRQDLKGCPK
jgi:hypothetical protein